MHRNCVDSCNINIMIEVAARPSMPPAGYKNSLVPISYIPFAEVHRIAFYC
jgi:hypothetical protein